MMDRWNLGILGRKIFIRLIVQLLHSHNSIVPIFHFDELALMVFKER
jgi:hypothetical protein